MARSQFEESRSGSREGEGGSPGISLKPMIPREAHIADGRCGGDGHQPVTKVSQKLGSELSMIQDETSEGTAQHLSSAQGGIVPASDGRGSSDYVVNLVPLPAAEGTLGSDVREDQGVPRRSVAYGGGSGGTHPPDGEDGSQPGDGVYCISMPSPTCLRWILRAATLVGSAIVAIFYASRDQMEAGFTFGSWIMNFGDRLERWASPTTYSS